MAAAEQIARPGLGELLKGGAVAGEWILDPSRSAVSFKSRSMWGLVRVHGVFRQVTGNGTVSRTGAVSGVLTVAAASVNTTNAKRDTHLRSADFFDSDNYPDIAYTVQGIRPSGKGVTVTGTLSIRDRTRPLAFDGTATVHGDGEVWLDATMDIHRGDFGLTWNLLRSMSMNSTITSTPFSPTGEYQPHRFSAGRDAVNTALSRTPGTPGTLQPPRRIGCQLRARPRWGRRRRSSRHSGAHTRRCARDRCQSPALVGAAKYQYAQLAAS
jgi:polyisoprenoid-binding protein YceI